MVKFFFQTTTKHIRQKKSQISMNSLNRRVLAFSRRFKMELKRFDLSVKTNSLLMGSAAIALLMSNCNIYKLDDGL